MNEHQQCMHNQSGNPSTQCWVLTPYQPSGFFAEGKHRDLAVPVNIWTIEPKSGFIWTSWPNSFFRTKITQACISRDLPPFFPPAISVRLVLHSAEREMKRFSREKVSTSLDWEMDLLCYVKWPSPSNGYALPACLWQVGVVWSVLCNVWKPDQRQNVT